MNNLEGEGERDCEKREDCAKTNAIVLMEVYVCGYPFIAYNRKTCIHFFLFFLVISFDRMTWKGRS